MRLIDIDSNERFRLVEGVQYGEKQSSWVLNNLDKFRIGLEAELSYKEMDTGDLDQLDAEELSERFSFDYDQSLNSIAERYNVDPSDIKRDMLDVIMPAIDDHEVVITRDNDNFNTLIRIFEDAALCDKISKLEGNDSLTYELIKEVMDIVYDGGDYSDLEETIKPIYDFEDDYQSNGLMDAILNGSRVSVDTYGLINELDSLNESLNEHEAIVNGALVEESNLDSDALEEILSYGMDVLLSLKEYCENREYFLEHFKGSSRDSVSEYIETGASFSEYLETLLDDIGMTINEFVENMIGEFPNSYNAQVYHFYDIPTNDGDNSDQYIEIVESVLDSSGYSSDFKVIPEGGKMVEIITTGSITGDQIEEIYDVLFEIIKQLKQQGFTTRDSTEEQQGSGFHISISMPSYKGLVDPVKFLLLSNIMQLLPEDERYVRQYVDDIRENFKSKLAIEFLVGSLFGNKFKNNINLSTDYDKILTEWAKASTDLDKKFQSVNFQHIDTQNGRIEIRMFGGENYDYMKDEMWEETIRSMYALHLAGSSDEGKREYLQVLNRLANNTINELVGMDISEYYVTLKRIYTQFNNIFPNFQKAIDLSTASSYMMIDTNKYPHLMRSLGGAENKIPQYLEYELRMLGATEMDMAVTDLLRQNFNEFFPKSNGYIHKPNMDKLKQLLKVLRETVDEIS